MSPVNPDPLERRGSPEPDFSGPERRERSASPMGAFEHAVERAAEEATQRVAAVHRVRLVTQAFLAALTVSLVAAAVLGVLYKSQAQHDAQANSLANCRLVKGLSSITADFVETDARLRAHERSDAATASAVTHWRTVDEAHLQTLTSTNCQRTAGR